VVEASEFGALSENDNGMLVLLSWNNWPGKLDISSEASVCWLRANEQELL